MGVGIRSPVVGVWGQVSSSPVAPRPGGGGRKSGKLETCPANTFGSVQVLMQIVFLCTALTFFEVPKVSLRIGAGVLV